MSDYWIPVTISICLSLIAIARLWLDYKHKAEIQLTIRKALDSGEHLSAEMLEKIGVVKHEHAIDLRRAILLLALGVAIIVASYLIDILTVGLAISAFPITLAAAFFMLLKLAPRKQTS